MYNGDMEANMTVGELIENLKKLDPNATALVCVGVYTRRYPVASVTPNEITQGYGGCAIYISLPDNMHVVERKAVNA